MLHESLCPASLYIELVLQAVKQLAVIENMFCASFARVNDLEIISALSMSQDKIVQLVLRPFDQMSCKFNFSFLAQGRRTGFERQNTLQASRATTTHAVERVEIISADDTAVTAELERTRKLLQHMHQNQSQDRNQKFVEMITQSDDETVHDTLVYKMFFTII